MCLHPPTPRCCQYTNITDTCTLQRNVGQHAPSPATSPAGRLRCASRNHPRCAQSKPTTPAALCVASACAPAGTQAQEQTRLLASARRAQSSTRNCLRAALRCCNMHCCSLLLSMRCAIIWSKLGARRRKRACMLLRSRARATACVLHTAAATLSAARCCYRCGSVDISGLPSTIVNLGPHCNPIYDSVNVEDKQR